MKKTYIFLAAMLVFAGCVKENPAQTLEPETNGYAIEATSGYAASTKTTLVDNGDYYSVNWTSNDVISVNGQASASLTVDATAANKAVFTFAEEVNAPYCSVYPASAYKAESLNEGTATVVLPAVQTYVDGDFDANAAIMLGYSETAGKIAFNHAVAYMQIKVTTTDGAAVKSVSIKGNAKEAMSGEFTADFAAATLVNDANDESSVSVVCESGFASGKEVIIAIPARNYEAGVSVTLTDVNGHSKLLKSTVAFNAVAGVVYSTEMELKPKGIWNVEDWTAFAKAVSAGEDYSAYIGEDGEVNLMADLEIAAGNFQYVNAEWNGIFDGNGHTMTSPSRNCPLFAEIEREGVVKNLNTAGANSKETFANGPWCAASSFAKVNRGTIENCNNSMDTEITYTCPDNNGIVIGCFTGSNGGTIKNCKNTGNTIVNVTLAKNITTYSAPCIAGGFAGIGHTTKTNPGVTTVGYAVHEGEDVFPGTFVNCVNEGDLIVTIVGSGAKKTTVSAVGGICGLVVLDGVVFDGCSNSGNISRLTKGADGEYSNDGTSCVGGILGRAVRSFYEVNADGTLKLSNPHCIMADEGYDTQILNCTNSGTITHNVRYSAAIEIGGTTGLDGKANRHATAGGIVGLINGRTNAKAIVSGCTNTGIVTDGWSGQRHFVGGISGYSKNATFTDNVMTGSLKSYDGLSIGVAGGIVGAAYEGVTISGGSSKPSFDCVGTSNVYLCAGLVVGVSLGNVSVSNMTVGVGAIAKIKSKGVESTITRNDYKVYNELVNTTDAGDNTHYTTTVTNVTWVD